MNNTNMQIKLRVGSNGSRTLKTVTATSYDEITVAIQQVADRIKSNLGDAIDFDGITNDTITYTIEYDKNA